MFRGISALIFCLTLLVGTLVVLAGLAIDADPRVADEPAPTVEDLERIQRLFRAHDPRRLREGQRRTIDISERDLNLWIAHLLRTVPAAGGVRARTSLAHDTAVMTASIPVPASALGRYVNLRAEIGPRPGGFELETLIVGTVPIPADLATAGLALALARAPAAIREEIRNLLDAVTAVRLAPDRLVLDVEWRRDVVDRLAAHGRELVLPAPDRARLIIYFNRISTLASERGSRRVSLSEYLRPVFALAAERSPGSAAATENASALLALALHAAGTRRAVTQLLGPDATQLAPPVRFAPTLGGRADLAQHFLVSAALAGTAGTALADALGVFKEVDDSRGGSGFSFADLAADRAGVRLAEMAAAAPEEAQRKLVAIRDEVAFMPAVDRLPESLSGDAFAARFSDRNSAAYRLLIAEIERRIDTTPIHR